MVLLITSSVYSSAPFTVVNSSEVREKQLFISLREWLTNYLEVKLVVCDGSGFNFHACNLLASLGDSISRVEFLTFKNDSDKVNELGKGYGEGEIIHYALKNSHFLQGEDYFYKVTGRLFIKNADCILNSKKYDLICALNFEYKSFIFPVRCESMDTRFYGIRKEYYSEHFINLYKDVNDKEGIFLEHVFLRKFKSLLYAENNIKFWNNFEFFGVSGSTGKNYTDHSAIKKILYYCRCIIIWILYKLLRVEFKN
jgi:hypothetical protein